MLSGKYKSSAEAHRKVKGAPSAQAISKRAMALRAAQIAADVAMTPAATEPRMAGNEQAVPEI